MIRRRCGDSGRIVLAGVGVGVAARAGAAIDLIAVASAAVSGVAAGDLPTASVFRTVLYKYKV